MRSIRKIIFIVWIITPLSAYGQEFYFGHDLSYVNQMEDCGAVFKEDGLPRMFTPFLQITVPTLSG